jgi:REP element-mobilizing transposase RayT
MAIWHLTLASDGRRALFSGEAGVRAAVRTLARAAGSELVLFAIADGHVHVVALAERERVGRLGRALVLSLRAVAESPLEPARSREVESRSHMEWLVRYVLTQGPHHGLPGHPALSAGSCFQDLVGARAVEGLRLGAALAPALPRFRRRRLYEAVGLPPVEIGPMGDEDVRRSGIARVAAAVASALAVPPDLDGHAAPVVEARRAVAHLGHAVGFDTRDLESALRVSSRTARRLDERPVRPEILRAARVRLALEDAVAGRPAPGLA